MIQIPSIKIPSVRVGSIGPASNIGAGGATPAPPTPITYLTQWKIVGNSQVHPDPYLTSWKVSGNSVVQDGAIMSCGDLGQDGMYHVKISNGITIYDIPLTEPLRKVNDIADKIEFEDDVATITRVLCCINMGDFNNFRKSQTTKTSSDGIYGIAAMTLSGGSYMSAKGVTSNANVGNILMAMYPSVSRYATYSPSVMMGVSITDNKVICFYDDNYNQEDSYIEFQALMQELRPELIYELETPTTETIQVPDIAVSPTDTYTSANVTPYSAFEHTENKEIWSCGEYSEVDRKYHILVQPQGDSIADIALTEPLRKVNDVADTIEFPSSVEGKALLTRNLISIGNLGTLNTWTALSTGVTGKVRWRATDYASQLKPVSMVDIVPNILCSIYPAINSNTTYDWRINNKGVNISTAGNILIIDEDYSASEDYNNFIEHLNGVELIGELATPTTELVDAPQIEEAESYTMVISQGGKAVEWSSFITNSE